MGVSCHRRLMSARTPGCPGASLVSNQLTSWFAAGKENSRLRVSGLTRFRVYPNPPGAYYI